MQAPDELVHGEVFNIASGEHRAIVDIARDVVAEMDYRPEQIQFIGNRPGRWCGAPATGRRSTACWAGRRSGPGPTGSSKRSSGTATIAALGRVSSSCNRSDHHRGRQAGIPLRTTLMPRTLRRIEHNKRCLDERTDPQRLKFDHSESNSAQSPIPRSLGPSGRALLYSAVSLVRSRCARDALS